MTIYYNKKGEVVGTQTSSGYMSSYRNEDYERRTSKYVGDRYLPIVESGEWPETLGAVKRGDRVAVGAPLATLESSRSPGGLERAAAELLRAFAIGRDAPETPGLILERID